jgi:CBS domain containing-hemolysin-like protein
MDDPSSYIILFITLTFSAFFSGSEIAFVAANRLKIELDNNAGKISGRILSRFVKVPEQFISTMLMGNNIALVIYGIYFAKIINTPLASWGLNEGSMLLIQTLLATILILVTAEFLPKVFFQINPNSILGYIAVPLFLLFYILYLPTQLVLSVAQLFLKILRIPKEDTASTFTKVDLMHFVQDAQERISEDSDMDHEIKFLQNALDFSQIKARDCMVPRTEIIAVELETDIEIVKDKFIQTGLSKIVVYREDIDHIIGYVHSFDLFKKPSTVKQILLPISVIPEAMPGKQVLALFARQSGNIAIVIDEFGGTSGLLTIEDLIEEIFGEIEDEHDNEEWTEEKINDNQYLFSARHEIDYLNETYSIKLPESDEYDTLGGLILFYLERIPEKGDSLNLDDLNIKIEVTEVTDRRIDLVEITVA